VVTNQDSVCILSSHDKELTEMDRRKMLALLSVSPSVLKVSPALAGSAEPTSRNVRVFRAIIERGFSQGDLSIADEVCAANLIEHQDPPKAGTPGPEILKSQIQTARTGTRGFALTLEDFVESDNKVWGRSRASGTDIRSGKTFSFDVIDISRFEDGKLVEHWGIADIFALLQQTGALPPRSNN
jgi:ketosteroid isomerase-like protein